MNKPHPWSYTHARDFANCPLLYKEKYVVKSIKFVDTPATLKGKEDHTAFEMRVKTTRPLPEHLTRYEPWVARALTVGRPYAEMKAGITYDLKPTEYFGPDIWFRQQIDLAVVNTTAALAWDYKTGNPAYEDAFQLATTAVSLMVKFPQLQSVSTANVWLKTGELGEVHRYTRADDYQRIAVQMYDQSARIEQARERDEWPAKPSGLCKFCDVLSCQHNKKGR